jgi:hypothetical protein
MGYLTIVTTPPGLPVMLNGQPTSLRTPLKRPMQLPEGKHVVSFEMPDGKRYDFAVVIAGGGTTKLVKRLR